MAAKEQLAALPCNIIVTGHPLDMEGEAYRLPPNIVMGLGRKTIDLLQVADALITDFSAVTYESIAAGVPVFFYATDIAEYRKSPGLNVDPSIRFADRFSQSLAEAVGIAIAHLDEPMADLSFPGNCILSITDLVLQHLRLNG